MQLPTTQHLLPESIDDYNSMQELLKKYMEHCQLLRSNPQINMRQWNETATLLELEYRRLFPQRKRKVNPFIQKEK